MKHLNGVLFYKESIVNGWKLLDTEEKTLSRWILGMHQCSLSLQISHVHYLVTSTAKIIIYRLEIAILNLFSLEITSRLLL